ncbi:MAG: transcription antitermination factor NusB [Tenericutes bacterium HGW-Tenericutes-5]|jgi:N utilization substance protein B|nr:MAG: transcription antitermination factor NusB [Tenericutes bacterium HGW-Tenericutes-5]
MMMKRREFRDTIVKLIYQDILGGEYCLLDYDEEVNLTIKRVQENYERLDAILEKNLSGWTIDRLNYVDLAIIRYATYEMIESDTPMRIIINEALEITKKYSNLDDDQEKKFNNRVLQNIKEYLEKANG